MHEILGDETCAYLDEQLAKEMQKQPGVGYFSKEGAAKGASHIGLTSKGTHGIQLDYAQLYG